MGAPARREAPSPVTAALSSVTGMAESLLFRIYCSLTPSASRKAPGGAQARQRKGSDVEGPVRSSSSSLLRCELRPTFNDSHVVLATSPSPLRGGAGPSTPARSGDPTLRSLVSQLELEVQSLTAHLKSERENLERERVARAAAEAELDVVRTQNETLVALVQELQGEYESELRDRNDGLYAIEERLEQVSEEYRNGLLSALLEQRDRQIVAAAASSPADTDKLAAALTRTSSTLARIAGSSHADSPGHMPASPSAPAVAARSKSAAQQLAATPAPPLLDLTQEVDPWRAAPTAHTPAPTVSLLDHSIDRAFRSPVMSLTPARSSDKDDTTTTATATQTEPLDDDQDDLAAAIDARDRAEAAAAHLAGIIQELTAEFKRMLAPRDRTLTLQPASADVTRTVATPSMSPEQAAHEFALSTTHRASTLLAKIEAAASHPTMPQYGIAAVLPSMPLASQGSSTTTPARRMPDPDILLRGSA